MCTQHPIEEHCKLDPPWDGPQVIPAQLRRVDNLIFRRLNQFSRANGVEQTTPMHGWIIEYLYRHRDEPVFQRDIEREFSITRSTGSALHTSSCADTRSPRHAVRRHAVRGSTSGSCDLPKRRSVVTNDAQGVSPAADQSANAAAGSAIS